MPETEVKPSVRMEKKLTPKKIMGKTLSKDQFFGDGDAVGTEVAIFNIAGIARMMEPGETDFGPYVEYIGDFAAVRRDTGEMIQARRMIMPEVLSDALVNALMPVEGVAATPVQFAFEIGVRRSSEEKGGRGYEFTCRPLLAPVESDQLADLQKRFLQHTAPVVKQIASTVIDNATATHRTTNLARGKGGKR